MLIFSFDCAIKNFGYCVVEIKPNDWRAKIKIMIDLFHTFAENLKKKAISKNTLNDFAQLTCLFNEFLDSFINVKAIGLRDIRDGQTEKLSANKTKSFLNELDEKYGKPNYVLVEKQMSLNNHAFAVENFVEYHYALGDGRLIIVSPGLKNLIYFDQKNGKYECFIGKQSNYLTNKKHTTYNCKYFFEHAGIWQKFGFDQVKKFDDISDAFMMCMAWVLLKYS